LSHPWWTDTKGDDQTLELIFEGISWGGLDLDLVSSDYDEALEDFSVREVQDISWAQPDIHSIFCSDPMSAPSALYAKLETFLRKEEAFRTVADFLNGGDSLAKFTAIASSSSYLVARGPEIIRQLV